MWFTDSGIVSKTSWREFWKAASEILVTLEGIFNATHPCVRMSCCAGASTSFLLYTTVTRDSSPKNLAEFSASASSMIELLCSSSTFRILRSIGSWQGCFSRSIDFNSRTVSVVKTSRVMTPPCTVFNFNSNKMAPKDLWRSSKQELFAPHLLNLTRRGHPAYNMHTWTLQNGKWMVKHRWLKQRKWKELWSKAEDISFEEFWKLFQLVHLWMRYFYLLLEDCWNMDRLRFAPIKFGPNHFQWVSTGWGRANRGWKLQVLWQPAFFEWVFIFSVS